MTRAPRGVSARRFIRALELDGFELRRVRGSHRIYGHSDGRRVVVAYHALGRYISPGDTARDDCRCWLEGRGFAETGISRVGSPKYRAKDRLVRRPCRLPTLSVQGEHRAKIVFAFVSPLR